MSIVWETRRVQREEIEKRIQEIAKDKKYSIGQDRVQSELRKQGIKRSTSTINRIMPGLDLIKKRKKEMEKKKADSRIQKEIKSFKVLANRYYN